MRLSIKVGLNQSRTWSTTTVSVHNQYIKRKKWHQHGVKTGGHSLIRDPPLRKVGVLWPPGSPGSPPLRISIQTAGLAFGGTCLCTYRVRGVDASCAEHLTVESYTVFICQQSYLLLLGIPSPTHSFIPGLKPSFSANPSYHSPSFFFSGFTTWISQTV